MAEEKKRKRVDEQEEEKWLKYYSSSHQILLVGEGDFSFSACLAQSFGSASNIVASSRDSYDYVIKNYKNGGSNLSILDKLGASHLHEVDATKMKFHSNLSMRKFDRIIFNFPHAGFYAKEDNILLIGMHQKLLNGFFENASGMLQPNGQVHVNHKNTIPYCHWNLEGLASHNALRLIERVAFKKEDYPGYENKRGSGLKCDKQFLLGECCTFKFSFSSNIKLTKVIQHRKRPKKPAEPPKFVPRQPNSFEFGHPPSDFVTYMSGSSALNIPLERSRKLLQPHVRASQQGNILGHGQPRELLQAPTFAHHQGNYHADRQFPSNLVTFDNPALNIPLPLQTPIFSFQQRNILEHVRPREFPETLACASRQENLHEHVLPREPHRAPIYANQQRNYLTSRLPPSDLNLQMSDIPGFNGPPHIDHIFLKCKSIFGGYFEQLVKALGRPNHNPSYFHKQALQLGYKIYIAEDPSGSPSNYAYILEQLREFVVGRQAWQVSRQKINLPATAELDLSCEEF